MPEQILLIKLGALGDIIQAEGALHDIRCHHPDARLTVMTTPPYQQLFARCPWVDAVFLDPRHSRFRIDLMWQLRRQLRQLRWDRVYDLQQVSRTSFYYHWLFPTVDWLGDADGCRWHRRRPQDCCAAEHFQQSLAKAGLQTPHCLNSNVCWLANPVDDLLASAELQAGYVVLIPGCSTAHPEKRWPHYRLLAEALSARGLAVVTVPGPEEIPLCQEIGGTTLTREGRYLNVFDLAGVLLQAGLVVGNDTGPMHLAAHLGCLGLALFSSHARARHTGIQHSRCHWLETSNLADLPLATVLEKLTPLLATLPAVPSR